MLPLCLFAIYLVTGGGLGRIMADLEIAQAPVTVVPTRPPVGECRTIFVVSGCWMSVAYEVDGVPYVRDLTHVWFGRIMGEVPMEFVRSADDPSLVTTRYALDRQGLELLAFGLFATLAVVLLIQIPLVISRSLQRARQVRMLGGRPLRLRPTVLLNERRGTSRLLGEYPLTVRDQSRQWIFLIEPVEHRGGEPRVYLDEALRRLDLSRAERRLLAAAAR
ncbi:hypothetical protein [Oleomonas cavernae]|nr:hypothetical protein [Oleomonas cavernae]